MKALFVKLNCDFCARAQMAVNLFNAEVPLTKRIDIINILSGDPRTTILSTIYGEDSEEWRTPILVYDTPATIKFFKTILPTSRRRIVAGIYTTRHYLAVLRRMAN